MFERSPARSLVFLAFALSSFSHEPWALRGGAGLAGGRKVVSEKGATSSTNPRRKGRGA